MKKPLLLGWGVSDPHALLHCADPGCGLDKLQWPIVQNLIRDTFPTGCGVWLALVSLNLRCTDFAGCRQLVLGPFCLFLLLFFLTGFQDYFFYSNPSRLTVETAKV